ncbi:hypothetical protein KC727_02575 [Candidatus Kaiserbacteria bacterium]|nr:hypothetical protein [Candidatus Kaiserbacteria bacterium]
MHKHHNEILIGGFWLRAIPLLIAVAGAGLCKPPFDELLLRPIYGALLFLVGLILTIGVDRGIWSTREDLARDIGMKPS